MKTFTAFLFVVLMAGSASALECVVGGCAGGLCSEKGKTTPASMCMHQESYACYQKTSTCGVQQDDEGNDVCGWEQTEALAECLKATSSRAGEVIPE